MRGASRRLAWAAAACVVACGGPAVADPQRYVIASKTTAGECVRRVMTHDRATRIRENDAATVFTSSDAIDSSVTVVRGSGASVAERLDVEYPRALTAAAATTAGAAPRSTPPSVDPWHGATIRYERDGAGWRTAPVAGPTGPLLLAFLATPRGDPLRRSLVPQGEMYVGQTFKLPDSAVHDTLAEMLPLGAVRTQGLTLRLDHVEGKGDAAVARFVGTTRVNGETIVPTFRDTALDWDLAIALDVPLADGRPRTVTISGSFKLDVVQAPRNVRAEFELSVSETATNAAPGDKYVRPPDAWPQVQTLAPALDGRPWSVAYHRLAATSAKTAANGVTEWILDGEKLVEGSEDGWTELVAVHRTSFPAAAPPTLADVAEALHREVARAEPGVVWKIVRSAADEFVYEWSLRSGKHFADQTEIGRLVRAKDAVLRVRYVRKTSQLAPEERAAWLARLAAATIVTGG